MPVHGADRVTEKRESGWSYISAAVERYSLSKARLERAVEEQLVACKTVKNPHYSSGPPARLVRVADIEANLASLKRSADEQERHEESSRRSKENAEKRRADLLQWVDHLEVEVVKRDPTELVKVACKHYNHLWMDRGREDKYASPKDSPDFLNRITVNMLRHEGTEYEELLVRAFGAVGADEARVRIKERVLDAIAAQYPHLAGECERQKRELSGNANA